jgi:phosphatidylglycerol:prolipoprotein diacylglycerol transferase
VRPVLFHLWSYAVPTHDFFVLLGVLAGLLVFLPEARRRNMLDERILWIVVGALLCGAVAARLSALWRYVVVAPEPTLRGFLVGGGRSILGGLAGAYAGVLLTKRLVGYRAPTGDLFAPAVALAMAVGRWGCFFTELPGTPTRLPWAVTFYDGVARHPSFIYEIIFQSGLFGVLWWARPRVPVKGELFKIYLLAYALFRFAVEFVRGNDVVWGGLTRPQLFLIPATAALAVYFAERWAPRDHAALSCQGAQR